MKIYKKRKRKNKIKQAIEKTLICIYAIVGVITILTVSGLIYYKGIKFVITSTTKTIIINEQVEEKTMEKQEPKLNIDEIVRRIMGLESSFGKNNYSKCEAIGQYNRYGFGIYNGKYQCFELDKDTEAVKCWITEKLKKYSLEQTICGYNKGFKDLMDNCDYLNKFLAMKGGGLYE